MVTDFLINKIKLSLMKDLAFTEEILDLHFLKSVSVLLGICCRRLLYEPIYTKNVCANLEICNLIFVCPVS